MLFKDLAVKEQHKHSSKIMLARVGNQHHELSDTYNGEKNVEFLDINTPEGIEVYKKSLTFVMVKAFHDIIPGASVRVMFSLGSAIYCEANISISDKTLKKVQARIQQIIDNNYTFNKITLTTTNAIAKFNKYKMFEKASAFNYRRISTTNLYEVDGFENYFYADLVYSTGDLSVFGLEKFHDGFLLRFPTANNPNELGVLLGCDKVYNTLKASSDWANGVNVRSAGELNDVIVKGQMSDLILQQEAVMENDISNIAENIIASGIKTVLIAGPSSSGKTSSSYRLSIQLRTKGYYTHPIAADDYFINRDEIPFDENGKQNFEALNVVDLEQLENDVAALIRGEEVSIPHFNFVTGKREYNGKTLKLGEKDILIIEGIHCLNPLFLPNINSYRIYVSALPVLNLDGHNYISSSNSRLLRRIARDARHRGTSAQKTISMWESVRKGEEDNIFPYQENADAVLNSSLIYELPVLKTTVEPLLFAVDRNSAEWAKAKTLLKFLDFFLGYNGNEVPYNSIFREFMGGSIFNVG